VISEDDVQNRKPDPEPYLLALKKFNSKAGNTIAIDDNPLGIASAKEAGLKCIAVPNDFTKEGDFGRADLTLNSLKEINEKVIQQL